MTSSIELVENTQSPESNLNNQTQPKLLLIENDNYLSKAFTEVKESSYQVNIVSTNNTVSPEIREYLLEHNPDMIVIDIANSTDEKPFIVQNIRVLFQGLLVVLSNQNSEQEQVDAFKFGADDYLSKPIDNRILMMRIEALFRRKNDKVNQVELASLTSGDVCLLPKSQKCFINGDVVKLTTFEFNLLKFLLKREGQILSRDKLYSTLLGRAYNGVERTIDVRMSQLREKLTFAGMIKNQIETVWGQGYMFNNNKVHTA